MPADRGKRARHLTGRVDDESWAPSKVPAEPEGPNFLAFAVNLTPGTYTDEPFNLADDDSEPQSTFFPPPATDAAAPAKPPKPSHSKKKADGHIPRPPNAFILFRSDFIKGKHVLDGVERDHSALSKIAGGVWRSLPDGQRQPWQRRAAIALAEHRAKYPDYKYKPAPKDRDPDGVVKTKRKMKEAKKKDPERCDVITSLIVEGKTGEELHEAVTEYDSKNVRENETVFETPLTAKAFRNRRASSAPIPEESAPFLSKRSSSKAAKPRASSSQPARSSLSVSVSPSPSPSPTPTEPSSPASSSSLDESFYASSEYAAPSPSASFTFPAPPSPLDTSGQTLSEYTAPSPTATLYDSGSEGYVSDYAAAAATYIQPQPQLPPQLLTDGLSRFSTQDSFDTSYSPVSPLSANPSFDQWNNNTFTMPNTPELVAAPQMSHPLSACSSYESLQFAMPPVQQPQQQYDYGVQPSYDQVYQQSTSMPEQPVQQQAYYPSVPQQMPTYAADYQQPQYCQPQQQVSMPQGYYNQYQAPMEMTHLDMAYSGSLQTSFYAGDGQPYSS